MNMGNITFTSSKTKIPISLTSTPEEKEPWYEGDKVCAASHCELQHAARHSYTQNISFFISSCSVAGGDGTMSRVGASSLKSLACGLYDSVSSLTIALPASQ